MKTKLILAVMVALTSGGCIFPAPLHIDISDNDINRNITDCLDRWAVTSEAPPSSYVPLKKCLLREVYSVVNADRSKGSSDPVFALETMGFDCGADAKDRCVLVYRVRDYDSTGDKFLERTARVIITRKDHTITSISVENKYWHHEFTAKGGEETRDGPYKTDDALPE